MCWHFDRNAFKTLTLRPSIHNFHNFGQHHFIFLVDLSHTIIAILDHTPSQMTKTFRLTLIDVALEGQQLGNKNLLFLCMHKLSCHVSFLFS